MRLRTLALGVLAVLVLTLAVTPITLSYVKTDSMEPTLTPDDMYLLVPTDNPEAGDIVTFRSEAYGGLVTHRIIGTTGDAYLTKGDANQASDQAGSIPPVTDDQIIGEVLTVGGRPVVIPDAAIAVQFISKNQSLIVMLLLAGLVADLLVTASSGTRTRSTSQKLTYGDLFQTFVAVAIIILTILIWVSITTTSFTVVATSSPTQGATGHVELGAQEERQLATPIVETPGFHRIIEVEGATLLETVSKDNGEFDVRIEVGPYTETGRHSFTIQYAAYPLTLPPQVITTLHHIHPLLAAFATASAPMLAIYVLLRLLMDSRVPVQFGRTRTLQRWFN